MVRGAVGTASPSSSPPDAVRTEGTGCLLCVFSLVVYMFIYLAFTGSLKFVSITETVVMVERDRREVFFVERGKDNSLHVTKQSMVLTGSSLTLNKNSTIFKKHSICSKDCQICEDHHNYSPMKPPALHVHQTSFLDSKENFSLKMNYHPSVMLKGKN